MGTDVRCYGYCRYASIRSFCKRVFNTDRNNEGCTTSNPFTLDRAWSCICSPFQKGSTNGCRHNPCKPASIKSSPYTRHSSYGIGSYYRIIYAEFFSGVVSYSGGVVEVKI